jgi:5-oxoprolinase (ATP-hydrolysing) subunit A
MAMATIDLNADLGESFGAWTMGDDTALLKIVTSANVACGFHGGDPTVMFETARTAKANNVAIGAHPGFNDLAGFGRRVIRGSTMAEIEYMTAYQIGALQALAKAAGHAVTHVKPHGALGNLCNDEDDFALAIGRAIKAVDARLVYVVMPGRNSERAADKLGLPMVREVFADRTYDDHGQLTSRKLPGSVIHDPREAVAHVLRMVTDRAITSVNGKKIPVSIDTICVHGDKPSAVDQARQVRAALEAQGLKLAPFPSPARL